MVGKNAVASGAPTTSVDAVSLILKLVPKCPYPCATGDVIVCAYTIGVRPRSTYADPIPGSTCSLINSSPAATFCSVSCSLLALLIAITLGIAVLLMSFTKVATVVPVNVT